MSASAANRVGPARRDHQHLRRWSDRAWRVPVAMVLLGAAAAGCVGVTSPEEVGTGAGRAARTMETAPMHLRGDLMDVSEVRNLVALGFDMRDQPVLGPDQFDVTHITGPCGASIPTPYSADSGFKVFRSTVALVVEDIAEPGPDAARGFLDAVSADAHPGCPPFDAPVVASAATAPPGSGSGGTAAGATVHVEPKGLVDVSSIGEQRVAWSEQRTAPGGGPDAVSERDMLVARQGGRVTMVAVIASAPVDLPELLTLFHRATDPPGSSTTSVPDGTEHSVPAGS
jgi:hypothetical protein